MLMGGAFQRITIQTPVASATPHTIEPKTFNLLAVALFTP